MLPTQSEVKQYTVDFIHSVRVFSNERFDLDINTDLLEISIGFRICRRLATGGSRLCEITRRRKGALKFNLGNVTAYSVQSYTEYASFNRDSQIGGFPTSDWRMWIRALVAHEYAHVVQHMLPSSNSSLRETKFMRFGYYRGLGQHEGTHGVFFQRIYGILRDKFVNPYVEDVGTPRSQQFEIDGENPVITQRKRRRANAIITQHPLIGRTVMLNGTRFVIHSLNTAARKYPVQAATASGTLYKLSMAQIRHNFTESEWKQMTA